MALAPHRIVAPAGQSVGPVQVRVTPATRIPGATCPKIDPGYRDWRTIPKEDFAKREAGGAA